MTEDFKADAEGIYCASGDLAETLWNKGNASPESIARALDGLATALTNRGRVLGTDSARKEKMFARERAVQYAVCTKIEWAWLALSATVLIATAILLTAMIGQSLTEWGGGGGGGVADMEVVDFAVAILWATGRYEERRNNGCKLQVKRR